MKTYLANLFATLEDDECRHRPDIVLGRDLRDLVDINLEELDVSVLRSNRDQKGGARL